MAKIVPAQTVIQVAVAHDTNTVVDIAQCLSTLNRRLYRQGMSYYVESIRAFAPAMTIVTRVAPDTWITHNAWKKGFRTWLTMQNEHGDGAGGNQKGKWADFKVSLDDSGATVVTPRDGNPASANGDLYVLGEWELSNYVYDDNGTTRSPTIHLIGTSAEDTAIGLISAYGQSRNYPADSPQNPSVIETGFYAQFHGVGDIDDELAEDLRDQNDFPPYDQDQYPGGHDNGDHPVMVGATATTPEFPVATLGGFVAPCGLVNIFQQNAASGTVLFLITVGIGPYKGVMASRMGQ